MAEIRMVIGTKEGKSYQLALDADKLAKIRGKKIGDKIQGELVGLAGYELEIRGGTDKNGFPMRPDLPGAVKKRLLLAGGVGYRPKEKGVRRRKMVRGNTIDEDIAQINVTIVKEASGDAKKLEALLGKKEGAGEPPAKK